MKVSDYIAYFLAQHDVTDAFGVPGGVILSLLEALANTKGIKPHLSYHEQMAGFAACGYAQASGRLGVAYATRGPGIANMITSIAEAYQESLPVLFITAHGRHDDGTVRFENNQELNIVKMVSGITKFSRNVEKAEEIPSAIEIAYRTAVTGRKGPVLLDIKSALWSLEISADEKNEFILDKHVQNLDFVLNHILEHLNKSERPVILIGDGIRNSAERETILNVFEKIKIPVLSSRGSQDILSSSKTYFGYIGSHGVRYSNFILSKADLIISLGNRLSFPTKSKSFSCIFNNAKLIRIDIDPLEFKRKITNNEEDYAIDLSELIKKADKENIKVCGFEEWLEVCENIKRKLYDKDSNETVRILEKYIKKSASKYFVCDVGNNEFWFSRAFEKAGEKGTLLCSKSFGTLGVGIGRAIGAYYAIKRPVTCVVGDQGFQYNIQELQYLAQWNLPITIIILNNRASGMIADHEKKVFSGGMIHVNEECGYYPPRIEKIANAYGIKYTDQLSAAIEMNGQPLLFEIRMTQNQRLIPNLPKGNLCQDMEPLLDRSDFCLLNNL